VSRSIPHPGGRRWLAWALALLPTPVAAQGVPTGAPEGVSEGDAGTEGLDSTVAGRIIPSPDAVVSKPSAVSSTVLWLRLGGSWDDNPRFLPEADGHAKYLGTGGGGLSFNRRGSQGALSLSGDAWLVRAQSGADLDRVNYSGALSGSYRLSPRVTTSLRGTYGRSDSRESTVLTSSGLLYAFTRTSTITGATELAWQMSRRNSALARVGYEDVSFEASPLIDGAFLTTSATLSHQLGPTSAIGLSYAFQATTRRGPGRPNHAAFASWGGRMGRVWSLALSAGATYRVPLQRGGDAWTTYGSADLTGHFRQGAVTLRYSRSLGLAYGLGEQRLADVASGQASRKLGRSVELSLSGSWAVNRDPDNITYRLKSYSARGSLAWSLSRRFDLQGGYYWSRSRPAASGSTLASQGVYLSTSLWMNWT
jgi:hypothetical protein